MPQKLWQAVIYGLMGWVCSQQEEVSEMVLALGSRGVKGFRSKVFPAHPPAVDLLAAGQLYRVKNLALCSMPAYRRQASCVI
jgi:hypothetical protein